ncbi:MAG: hypothetical protein H8E17_08840 [Deltaproteobacteria bacterium]|nr:hypothetical protein [Deltaproteobacteria bacterium]
MENSTFFYTSKPLPQKRPDSFEQALSESIENEVTLTDKNSRLSVMASVVDHTVFITGEIVGQSDTGQALEIRKVINRIYDRYLET